LQGRNNAREVFPLPKGAQYPHAHPGNPAAEEGRIKGVPDIAVFLLQDAEGAMVGGEFAEIKGYKRENGGDRDEESCHAEGSKQISPPVFQRGIYSPPPSEETSIDLRGRGATRPMLPARSDLAPRPQQRWSHHFFKTLN